MQTRGVPSTRTLCVAHPIPQREHSTPTASEYAEFHASESVTGPSPSRGSGHTKFGAHDSVAALTWPHATHVTIRLTVTYHAPPSASAPRTRASHSTIIAVSAPASSATHGVHIPRLTAKWCNSCACAGPIRVRTRANTAPRARTPSCASTPARHALPPPAPAPAPAQTVEFSTAARATPMANTPITDAFMKQRASPFHRPTSAGYTTTRLLPYGSHSEYASLATSEPSVSCSLNS